jgi:hypothetical protein
MVVGGASVLSNYGGSFVHKYTTLQCTSIGPGGGLFGSGCAPENITQTGFGGLLAQ